MPAPTYCNPLALIDYPMGMDAGRKAEDCDGHWTQPVHRSYREMADPTVIFEDGTWFLYPSCGQAWVTTDFRTWRHHPIGVTVGYAPTVVKFRGKFLLTACDTNMFVSDTPLGPWRDLGPMLDAAGAPVKGWVDPMLFADDDGRLYAYWGIGGPGVSGAEVDGEQPRRLKNAPAIMCKAEPLLRSWERFGACGEDASQSYMEGPWLFKHAGRYYLTYAAPGTEFHAYGMGAYVARSPLGPFHYQQRNPILRTTHGIVTGPGHGCIVRGPQDTLWAFYTCLVRNHHDFERRIGMDPVGIDANGELFVLGASSTPQWAPGVPVSVDKRPRASSEAPGRSATYATDLNMRTWWQAADGDRTPWIEIHLRGVFDISALRVIWAEAGLDHDHGVPPGPMRYRLEATTEWKGEAGWATVLDRSANGEDFLIDYRTFATVRAVRVRLVIVGWPAGIVPSLIDFTVFGTSAALAG
jgi:hypothetical protein